MEWSKWAIAQKQGLNQKEIAKLWGISEGSFTYLLAGKYPGVRTVAKIAQSKNLKVWQLIKEIEEF